MPTKVFECQECWTWYDDEDDARGCCPPEVRPRYKCEECEDVFDLESSAELCEMAHQRDYAERDHSSSSGT